MPGIQFNSHSDLQDVVSEINLICNSDNNSYPLKAKARRVNSALDRFFTLAFQAGGQWTYDDPSNDSLPIQTIDLVSGTVSYNLDDFTSEILNILRIEIANSAAADHFDVLERLDRTSIDYTSLTDYQPTSGVPKQYDLVGEFLRLYPATNYNATAGLRIYLERNKVAFASTDTTKTLPVPSLFSQYICNHASLPYLIENQIAQKNDIAGLIQRDEAAIIDYFGNREKGVRKRATMNIRNFR